MNFFNLLAQSVLLARSDAITAADREGIIRFWNPGGTHLWSVRDDAIGHSLDLVISERLKRRHRDGYRRAMESGKSRYGEGDKLYALLRSSESTSAMYLSPLISIFQVI